VDTIFAYLLQLLVATVTAAVSTLSDASIILLFLPFEIDLLNLVLNYQ